MIVTQSPPKSVSWAGRALVVSLLGVVAIAPVRGQAQRAAPQQQPGEPLAAATTASAPVDETTRQAVLALLEAARDRDQQVSQAAHAALMQFGPSAIPVLVESLNDARTAPFAMGLIAQRGPQAIDALRGALESRDADVRARALHALEQMIGPGPMNYGGLPGSMGGFANAAMMEDPALMGMPGAEGSAPGADFLPRLIGPVSKAARDDDANVRAAAVQLLTRLAIVQPDAALVDPLVAAVKDPSIDVRRSAAMGLGRLGPMAAGAVDALAAAVGDRDIGLRVSALEALASMGPNAKGAMATIVAAMKAPEPQIRSAAARALGTMHAQPQPQPVPGAPGFGAMMGDWEGEPPARRPVPAAAADPAAADPSLPPVTPNNLRRGR